MLRLMIEAEYRRLGYDQGWAFAMTPMARMHTAGTMIIGLNPGGESHSEDTHFESENSNAYYTGVWTSNGSPTAVQTQVRLLHELLGLSQDETFAAQYIPFRSASFESLQNKTEALGFAYKLWSELMPNVAARRIVCMGNTVFWQIVKLLDAKHFGSVRAGWGSVTIKRAVAGNRRLVVGIPHPSRFQLLGGREGPARSAREAAMRHALAIPIGSARF